MAFSLNQLLKWLILTLLFPLIFLNGWLALRLFHYFQPIVTTFVLAGLLAFILNYPVSVLQQKGMKRNYAVGLVFLSSLVILIAFGITVVPIILEQLNEFGTTLPQWIDASEVKLEVANNWAISHGLKINISEIFSQVSNSLPGELEFLGDRLFHIIIDTIDSISEALITLVLTFYLLLDGQRLWDEIFKKLPFSFGLKLQNSIQQNFQNYLIGQVALGLLMGVSLTVTFLILQVPFGLILGLGIGIFSLIPFGDVVSLVVVTLIIAIHDFWLALKVFAIAVVIDQLIDQVIAPRLLGSFTGLRPIWIITSLLIGTYVGGLLGLLIAVPLAGVIKNALSGWDSAKGNIEGAIASGELPEMFTDKSTAG